MAFVEILLCFMQNSILFVGFLLTKNVQRIGTDMVIDIIYSECRYNMVQYDIILYKVPQWLGQNLIRGWTHKRPYLTLMGEQWGIICEDLEENSPRFNGTTLHIYLWFG